VAVAAKRRRERERKRMIGREEGENERRG